MTDQRHTITKEDAATRQLGEAVRLFFRYGDLLAIHTLASAALQLLVDLGEQRGVSTVVQRHDHIRPERLKEWLAAIVRTRNFLKHADRDSDDLLDYGRRGNGSSALRSGDIRVGSRQVGHGRAPGI